MAGRAQAFSDPEIIRILTTDFMPVAENSSSLERQQDDKGEFFRAIANQGHYAYRTYPTSTRQGSYAFTADGRFLDSINTRDPRQMEGMLVRARARFDSPEPEAALAPGADDRTTTPTGYPDDGLVLRLFARDLPREHDTRPDDWRKIAWNLDYAWFLREETETLVPSERRIGAQATASNAVTHRLGRAHLRDFVRGEPVAWPKGAVREAMLTSEITGIDGDEVQLALSGHIRLEHDITWTRPEDGEVRSYPSGYDATLAGEATWDDAAGRFTRFDLVATGPRWGACQYNNREDDLGPAPLAIVFTLAGDSPAERTAPHCLRSWASKENAGRPTTESIRATEYFNAV